MRGRVVVALLLSLCAITSAAPPLLVTAEGEHAWVVLASEEEPGEACRLLHFTSSAGPEQASEIVRLPRLPEAMTSLGNQLWLIFAPVDAATPNRDVVTLRVEFNSASKEWYPVPSGHLEVLPSLPGTTSLRGVIASDEGLFVLGEKNDGSWIVDGLTGREWEPVAHPNGPVDSIGRAGDGDQRLAAFTENDQIAIRTGKKWAFQPMEASDEPLKAILALEGTTVLVRGTTFANFGYLRAGGAIAELASVEAVAGEWTAVAMESEPWLVEQDPASFAVSFRQIASIDGVVSLPRVVGEGLDTNSLLQLPLMGMAIISGGIIVLLLRPFIEGATADPQPGLEPLPVLRRAAGLALDLIPGAVLAIVVFDLSARELVESFFAVRTGDALPALVVVLSVVMHTAVTEVLWGTSLGKRIVGGKVVALTGEPATRLQLFLRVIAKGVVLLLPLLGLLLFLEPLSRGMPELISRTIVVRSAH